MNGSLRVKDKIYLIKMHISTKINFTIFTYLYLLHLSFSFRSLEELPCLPFGIDKNFVSNRGNNWRILLCKYFQLPWIGHLKKARKKKKNESTAISFPQ